jgi:hypothetical protein
MQDIDEITDAEWAQTLSELREMKEQLSQVGETSDRFCRIASEAEAELLIKRARNFAIAAMPGPAATVAEKFGVSVALVLQLRRCRRNAERLYNTQTLLDQTQTLDQTVVEPEGGRL